ncbi:MAG: LysR family transcriptional regulator [Alphaproteobacteria bacterium]|nr:LysR family transcriptional regulator [Alphaproteobacteria bacterium]
MMERDDLALIVAVAEEGSLTRAARRLDWSLNATSRRLARLEEEVGVLLVQRTTRSCALTEPGEACYRQALVVLDQIARLEGTLAEYREPAGTVRVRLPASAVTAELLARFRSLLAHHEDLRVQVSVTRRDLPPTHEADIAVFVGELPDRSGLVARRVRVFRWVCCAAPAYVASRGAPDTVADLATHETLRYRTDAAEDRWVLDHLDGRRESVPVAGSFEADDGRVLAEATYGGLGIGILPEQEVRAGERAGTLVPVLPGWSFAPPPVFLVGPRGRMRHPAVRTVADAMEQAFAATAS